MTDDQVARLAKVLVVVITLVALYFAIYSATTLVNLLLLGYAGVTQFLPGVLFGLYWKRVTKPGVFTGLVTGIAGVAYLVLTKQDPFFGINAGFFSLCVNFIVTIAVSLMTKAEVNPFNDNPASSEEAKGSI
jgi:SSS family solute:Na+ symporter